MGGKAPEPASEVTSATEDRTQYTEAETTTAPPAPVEEAPEDNDVLADLNAQLKNMLM